MFAIHLDQYDNTAHNGHEDRFHYCNSRYVDVEAYDVAPFAAKLYFPCSWTAPPHAMIRWYDGGG